MMRKHKTEVLVAGAGPVGLFTALSLAHRGIGVAIIDGQERTAARSYALALHPGSLALLDWLGLTAELTEAGHRLDRLAFYDGEERCAALAFTELETAFPFALVLPQQALEDALEKRLAEHGVTVKWSHRLAELALDGKRAAARIERLGRASDDAAAPAWRVEEALETRAAYVVGADGHDSAVRRALGVDSTLVGGSEFFGVFEFAADAEAPEEVRVVLDDASTNVLWPLADGRFRWSFELDDSWEFVPRTRAKSRRSVQVGGDAFPYLSREKLQELVGERAPWFRVEPGEIRWSVGVRFERRLAQRFGGGRAWLVGDAAHLGSPVGVQSMNVGLREGHGLARRLTEILRHGGDPDQLEVYNADRTHEWRRLLGLAGGPEASAEAPDWVRKRGPRIPSTVPASGEDLQQLLRQIGLELEL